MQQKMSWSRALTVLSVLCIAAVVAPGPAAAEERSCSQLGYPGCFHQVTCSQNDSGCLVGALTCDTYCGANDPYGGFDDNAQDCPNSSTRPTCCGAKRTECNEWCQDTYSTAGERDDCTWSVCHAEYNDCLSDGYFEGF